MAKRTCSVDGCPRPARTRGWCQTHYHRWKEGRDFDFPGDIRKRNVPPDGLCSVEGCSDTCHSNGFCKMHCSRWKRHGDPLIVRGIRLDVSPYPLVSIEGSDITPKEWQRLAALLAARSARVGDCLEWQGARMWEGYGKVSAGGKLERASRLAYALAHGRYPTLFICHHCDNPPCIEPSHLFEGTHRENMADMVAKGRSDTGPRRRRVGDLDPEASA